MGWEKFDSKISKAPLGLLEKGFSQMCQMEVELEAKLKELREAKARFLVEIDLRVNKR
jgi:hypothetical protein